MKHIIFILISICVIRCSQPVVIHEPSSFLQQDFLRGFTAMTADSLVNVVIEIPAGTSQKWEVSKPDGSLQWVRISADSMRMVPYLPYPANYGMVPRTLLPVELGGDGDPLDVFLLGPAFERGQVVHARLVGVIRMLDRGEQDNKIIAVSVEHWFGHINSLTQLQAEFPGVADILSLWLANYKGPGMVEIECIEDERYAWAILMDAMRMFEAGE
jgi:inorganic pyrophosphatase